MAQGNIITATFETGATKTTASGLWQWDYGQELQIHGLTGLPAVTEVHFAQNGEAKTVLGATEDDICTVGIPDAMLQSAFSVTAYIYLHTGEDDGETEYQIKLPVQARPQPETYDEEDPEVQQAYSALVAATELLNETTEQVIVDARAAAQEAIDDFLAGPLYPSSGITPNGGE